MWYHLHTTLSTDASTVAGQVFRANSIYDPDYTNVGTPALGYDKWSDFYHYYNVRSVKVVARCAVNATHSPCRMILACYKNSESTPDGNIIPFEQYQHIIGMTTQYQPCVLTRDFDVHKLGGTNPNGLNGYYLGNGSSPGADYVAWLHLVAEAASNDVDVDCDIDIEFSVELAVAQTLSY